MIRSDIVVVVGNKPYYKGQGAIAEVAEELANIMKRDNANFKRDLFLEACGLES